MDRLLDKDFTVTVAKKDKNTILGLVPLDPNDAEHIRWLRVELDEKQQTTAVEMLDVKDNPLHFQIRWSVKEVEAALTHALGPAAAQLLQSIRAMQPEVESGSCRGPVERLTWLSQSGKFSSHNHAWPKTSQSILIEVGLSLSSGVLGYAGTPG